MTRNAKTTDEREPEFSDLRWDSLPPIPDPVGFAGMYAGVSGGALLAGGGANFSERPHKEGGRKIWHDRVFALSEPGAQWQLVGRLPRPIGYGASVTWRDAVVCAGGGDATAHFSSAWIMRWDGHSLSFESLPDLPTETASPSGALVGDTLYVIGGLDKPGSLNPLARMFSIDLAQPAPRRRWTEEAWLPGVPGRYHPVVGVHDGELFCFSGIGLTAGPDGKPQYHYAPDAFAFRPVRGWRKLAAMPYATGGAPVPAITTSSGSLLVLSGVNAPWGSPTGPGCATPGFGRRVLAYSPAKDAWKVFSEGPGETAPVARVTAPLVPWRGLFVVVNGEVAPGIRTPHVLALTPVP